MPAQKPTIRDVARLSGVSIATVSAVINGTAVVTPKRAARVREAMEALDYHADGIARSLKTGRTNVIGMVIPDVTNPFYPEVITGVEEVAARAGYSVILCNTNEDPAQEQRQLNTLFARRVDGVLIACTDSSAAYDRLTCRRFPLVFFDRIPGLLHGPAVSADNAAGAYQATKHLIAAGHRRIALIAGNARLSTHAGRIEGFRQAMQEAGLPVLEEYFRIGGLQIAAGHQAGLDLFRLPVPPSAVFCSNNKMLLGLVRALGEIGIACPRQVSLVGFDDVAWTENFYPPLTTVAQPAREIGRKAMELLLARILGQEQDSLQNEQVLLPPELRIRASVGPPLP